MAPLSKCNEHKRTIKKQENVEQGVLPPCDNSADGAGGEGQRKDKSQKKDKKSKKGEIFGQKSEKNVFFRKIGKKSIEVFAKK